MNEKRPPLSSKDKAAIAVTLNNLDYVLMSPRFQTTHASNTHIALIPANMAGNVKLSEIITDCLKDAGITMIEDRPEQRVSMAEGAPAQAQLYRESASFLPQDAPSNAIRLNDAAVKALATIGVDKLSQLGPKRAYTVT